MIMMLRKMRGTVVENRVSLDSCVVVAEAKRFLYSLLINVRTELIRLIVFAFTLAPSCALPPPKEGSFCAALPQPTVLWVSWCGFVAVLACAFKASRRLCCSLLACSFCSLTRRESSCTYCVRGSDLQIGLLLRLRGGRRLGLVC
jgi:hypothetical protein